MNQSLQFENPFILQNMSSIQRINILLSTPTPLEPIKNKFPVGLEFISGDKIMIAYPTICHIFSFPQLQKLRNISSKGDSEGQFIEISCVHFGQKQQTI